MRRALRGLLSQQGPLELLIGLGGILLLWLLNTGASGEGIPSELLTIGGVTAIFMTGMGYADIRAKASSAHRRLDKRDQDDRKEISDVRAEVKEETLTLRKDISELYSLIERLTIALERNGMRVTQ